MTNPTYQVHIFYVPIRRTTNATASTTSYVSDYFLARMDQVEISATGSSYTEALANLLTIATSSNTNYTGFPIGSTRTW